MRGCGSLASARASILTLVAGSLLAPGVASAAKAPLPSPTKAFVYDTSGVVGIGANPASVNGPAVLEFQGVTNDVFHPKSGQTVELGQFVATPSTASTGQTTTYTGTPFEVQVQAPEFNKTNTVPVLASVFPSLGKQLRLKTEVENSLLLKGHLDGTIGPNGQVNVKATVQLDQAGQPRRSGHGPLHPVHVSDPIQRVQAPSRLDDVDLAADHPDDRHGHDHNFGPDGPGYQHRDRDRDGPARPGR